VRVKTMRGLAPVALAVVALGLAACGDDGEEDAEASGAQQQSEPLIIGEAIGRSGFMSAYDLPAAEGARIAAEEINAKGGADGRKITFVTADTASDLDQAAPAAQKVLGEGADYLISSCNYDYGAGAARVASQQGTLAFSYCAGSTLFGVNGVGPLAFNMGTVVPIVGGSMATFAKKRDYGSAYMLTDTATGYSKEMCQSFEKTWKQLGGTIAGKDSFQNEDKSIGAQVSRMKGTSADFIAFCSYIPGGATALRQIRAAGIDLPVVTGDGMDGESWLKAVPNLSDFYQTVMASIWGDDPRQEVNQFVDKFTERTGSRPEGAYALFGYSVVQALAKATEEAGGTEGQKVKGTLEGWKGVELLVGPTTFTPKYHFSPNRPMAVVQIQDGKASYLETVELAEAPDAGF
jgi:branched-chain amino acid transport system substrate-binding protein